MKITIIFIILIIVLGCSNTENINPVFLPKLPEITTTGANTFGCFVDGKLLTPRSDAANDYSIDYSQIDTYLELLALIKKSK